MLASVSKQAQECYQRAEECAKQAAATHDPQLRQDYLDSQYRWMRLARSYEFAERLNRFTILHKR
jgi:hypothetical protein